MDQIQNPDAPLNTTDYFISKIRDTLNPVLPELLSYFDRYPQGYQLDVNAARLRIDRKEEYAKVMRKELDPTGTRIIDTLGGKLYVEPRLGVMNFTRTSSGALVIDYRSQSGGKSFTLEVNEDSINILGSASEEEIYQACEMIFEKGEIKRNNSEVHITTTRSLAKFDRDGSKLT